MRAIFVELPAFQLYSHEYLDDAAFRRLQIELLQNPEAGDVIQGTGGLRKARFPDEIRSKGKRGGLRLIYYWWIEGTQFWMFTLYDKSEQVDLSTVQKKMLKIRLETEISSRRG